MDRIKVLVTGGAGYIGTHTVVELVQAGFDPIIVDDLSRSDSALLEGVQKIVKRTIPFYKVDCKNLDEMRGVFGAHKDITSVIHFAAYKSVSESVANPLIYYQNNIGSLLTLLKVMKESNVTRIVFSSSCTVYGQPDIIPVTEKTPFKRAESAYGATKQMCERVLEDEAHAWNDLRAISLRYFNPIGAHPSGAIGELPIGIPNNLVPYITQTAIGKREKLTVFGSDYNTPDGSCLRDFIHIVDLAKAHAAAILAIDGLKSRCEAFNIGTGVPVSVLELVNAFIRVTGVKLNYAIG
ncbi:MAG TPA: UDP-glucose 4-epimerase GalE, partial [Cyclobacteriaceae bacterium]|nr:UDP-glucose 4-epimerase GalE [Cyclobacteriaceae bacterium]